MDESELSFWNQIRSEYSEDEIEGIVHRIDLEVFEDKAQLDIEFLTSDKESLVEFYVEKSAEFITLQDDSQNINVEYLNTLKKLKVASAIGFSVSLLFSAENVYSRIKGEDTGVFGYLHYANATAFGYMLRSNKKKITELKENINESKILVRRFKETLNEVGLLDEVEELIKIREENSEG